MKFLGKKYEGNKNKNICDSFKHAYDGIIYAATKERNMHIHLLVATIVVIGGIIFSISYIEWLICLILIGLVLSLELLNTALETVVDMITTKEDPKAKIAKDAAAGAVLIISGVAAVVGVIIFLPKIFNFLMSL